MKLFLKKIFMMLLFTAFLMPCNAAPAKQEVKSKNTYTPLKTALDDPGSELMSLEKEDFIRNLIQTYIKMGADIMSKDVERAVLSDVAANMPLAPKAKMDGRNRAQLMNAARKEILPKFPKTVPQFRADLSKELEEKYKMYKIGEYVKIHYVRGPRRYVVEGTFHSFNGHSVRIGTKNVAYFDIVPEDKIRINKKYRDELFYSELESVVGKYRDQRSDALYRALYSLSRKQYINNHKAGFIHFIDNWTTARDLTQHLIERERFKTSTLAALALQEKKKQDEQNAFELKIDRPDEGAVLAKVTEAKNRVSKGKFSGIDLEQGQGAAYWGFTRGETRLAVRLVNRVFVFSREFYDYYFGRDRQIKEIRLDYMNGKFCRAVLTYSDVRNLQDFIKIRTYYTRLFGPDDLAKQGKPVPKNEVRSLTWTGKYTKGSLVVKYNEEDEMIERITFIKEDISNPYKETDSSAAAERIVKKPLKKKNPKKKK